MITGLDRLDQPVATPTVLRALCDDAAVFPPGDLPLEQAVSAHLAHHTSLHAELVGPLVVAMKDLPQLAEQTSVLPPASLDLSVTLPSPAHAREALRLCDAIAAVRLVALEVAVPECLHTEAVVPMLDEALDQRPGLTVYIEVPRDHRRDELFAELAQSGTSTGSPYLAKLRTGGLTADLYPGEGELAGAIAAAVLHGVAFKATAGLHHAVRNTDPATGFEQHGFLNLLLATDAAIGGAGVDAIAAVLAVRDGERLAAQVSTTSARVREVFCSFGTCSVSEPVTELAALGLLDARLVEELP